MSRNASVLISNNTALSNALDLGDVDSIIGIEIPAAWTAASLTFVGDIDNDGNFTNIYDDAGTELTIASASVVASRLIIPAGVVIPRLAGLVKIRSGTSAAPVNQGADRVLKILLGKR